MLHFLGAGQTQATPQHSETQVPPLASGKHTSTGNGAATSAFLGSFMDQRGIAHLNPCVHQKPEEGSVLELAMLGPVRLQSCCRCRSPALLVPLHPAPASLC